MKMSYLMDQEAEERLRLSVGVRQIGVMEVTRLVSKEFMQKGNISGLPEDVDIHGEIMAAVERGRRILMQHMPTAVPEDRAADNDLPFDFSDPDSVRDASFTALLTTIAASLVMEQIREIEELRDDMEHDRRSIDHRLMVNIGRAMADLNHMEGVKGTFAFEKAIAMGMMIGVSLCLEEEIR